MVAQTLLPRHHRLGLAGSSGAHHRMGRVEDSRGRGVHLKHNINIELPFLSGEEWVHIHIGPPAYITVNVDIFACIHFRELRKLAISRGHKFAFLCYCFYYGIIEVLFRLYIFSRI